MLPKARDVNEALPINTHGLDKSNVSSSRSLSKERLDAGLRSLDHCKFLSTARSSGLILSHRQEQTAIMALCSSSVAHPVGTLGDSAFGFLSE